MVRLQIPIRYPIVCRPALPKDTPGMLELTRHIWDGDDYVPHTWDDWMADPNGILAVAEFKAKIVGLGKLTLLSEVDWWLEGLRVHPEYQGRGIASQLNDYLLAYWQRNESGIVRLATISKREPVKYMVQKRGFELIGEFATYKTQLPHIGDPDDHPQKFTPVKHDEAGTAFEWLTIPGKVRLEFGVMDLGWQFAPPRIEFIQNYVEQGKLWWWRNQEGLMVMVTKSDDHEKWARIRLLACDRENYLDFLIDGHKFAERSGYTGITWKAPVLSAYQEKLLNSGFLPEKDYTLQIYEKTPE